MFVGSNPTTLTMASAEWRIKELKESLEREEAKLLRIMNDLQNVDNLQD